MLSREVLEAAVEKAKRGAEATAQMTPRLGRSSYLRDRVIGHADPGATAVGAVVGRSCGRIFRGEVSTRPDGSRWPLNMPSIRCALHGVHRFACPSADLPLKAKRFR